MWYDLTEQFKRWKGWMQMETAQETVFREQEAAKRDSEISRMLAENPKYVSLIEDARISGSPLLLVADKIAELEKSLGNELASAANTIVAECEHKVYRRGLLPGGVYIKTCVACGHHKDIQFAEWQTISDR